MLLLNCPYCGISGEETEFSPGGEAHIKRMSIGSTDKEFEAYLFSRKNPKGVHFERWRHSNGCGKWFHVARSTTTLEIFGSYKAQTLLPPKEIQAKIKEKFPNWVWEAAK